MTREAILRTLVYVGLIAVSTLLWWGIVQLWLMAGSLPAPMLP